MVNRKDQALRLGAPEELAQAYDRGDPRAEAAIRALARFVQTDDWRAAAWILEHCYKFTKSQKQEVEITVKDPRAEIDKLLSDMAERMKGGDE